MVASVDRGRTCAGDTCPDVRSCVEHLARLLAEPDEQEWHKHFADVGIPCDSSFIASVKRSASLCKRALLLYPEQGQLAISFNGGKDACVVLYLWIAVALAETSCGVQGLSQQTAIFFDSSDEFDGVRAFVLRIVKDLNLRMLVVEEKSFRKGMVDLVDGGVRAVVMGQRRGDPWMDDVDAFSPSTDGWPAFMRVNPIMNWSYGHVWTFLRGFRLPYCELYDEGYTSLGSVKSTFRNPSLRNLDGSYSPAYMLDDDDQERAGRMSRQVTAADAEAVEQNTSDTDTAMEPTASRKRSVSNVTNVKTAGLVVIGNELLNGKVHDSNSHFLCNALHKLGVTVSRIEVVPDDIDMIAKVIRGQSSTYDFVFTSGGIGPTHDDVTMAAAALAFGCPLVSNERLFALLQSRTNSNITACHKMAALPADASVEWLDDGNPWPIVSVQNVYIFAGMPCVLRSMFERAAHDGRFEGSRQFASASLCFDAEEAEILEALQQTVDLFPDVEIGSYPHAVTRDAACADADGKAPAPKLCRLTITFEAFDEQRVAEARRHLAAAAPACLLPAQGGTPQ
eukprot:TRINITY_DN30531_c0_g1_i1.p1 TRINITY_DN30531_c0_g1~~TRINITY_DN30531_c0_g1_i1.p1  ORF type:complete len:591 (-),score=90.79 TRINITY_DN30531_c0_g1_i1:71-1765(-)